MEERKLTDEEIVKALDNCVNGDYKTKCKGCYCDKLVNACLQMDKDILDLIHRLQGKIAEYEQKLDDGELVSKDWHDEQVLHLQEENDELQKQCEKVAERVQELEETLLDMVMQFCPIGNDGIMRHAFMSAEESAFDTLDINYGEKAADVYRRFQEKWTKPIDEICKEITEGGK